MVRGIDGVAIFRDDQDREDFLSRLEHLVDTTGTRILAWVLMDNHVHLLLFSGSSGIATFMRRLLTGYAIRFNRRHQRNGHLFQNRYKSIVCEEDVYLVELVRYIHLNPVRASVVKTIEELDRYRWSGHSVLVGKRHAVWQEGEYVLRQFSGKRQKAIRNYRQFVEEGEDQGRRPELVGGGLIRSLGGWSRVLSFRDKRDARDYDDRILGGGDFVREILKEADKDVGRQLRYRQDERPIEQEIQRMCREEGIKEEELTRGSQRRKVSEVRGKIAYYLHREKGIPMAEIARHVGVGTSAIAMAIRRIEVSK